MVCEPRVDFSASESIGKQWMCLHCVVRPRRQFAEILFVELNTFAVTLGDEE